MPQTRRQRLTSSQRSEREHSPSQDPEPEPAPSHGYGTRRSTQVARPAYALGLHKRTQAEIHAEAEKKRAAKEEKKQAVARKAERRAQGAKKLARLEDERILADADEDRYLAQSFAELQASENDCPDNGMLGDAQQCVLLSHNAPPPEPDLPMDWEIEDEPPQKMPPLMEYGDDKPEGVESDGFEAQARRRAIREGKKRATSADLDSHADDIARAPLLPSGQTDSDSSSEDGMAEVLAKLRRQDNARTKPGESSKHIDDEEPDIPRHPRPRYLRRLPAPAGFSSDDDPTHSQEQRTKRLRTRRDLEEGDPMDVDYAGQEQGREHEDDEDEDDAENCMQILGDAIRLYPTRANGEPSSAPLSEVKSMHIGPKSPQQLPRSTRASLALYKLPAGGKDLTSSRFQTQVRLALYQRQEPLPLQPRRHIQLRPLHDHASSSRAVRNERRMIEPDGSDVERSAFRDEDVVFSREYAVTMSGRRKSMLSAQRLSNEDAEAFGMQSSQKRKRKRRSPVPEDKSRSAANVPDFVKPVLFTELIPTILEYFGAKTDPWNTREHGPDELLNLSQELLNDLCPRAEYRLSKSDVIYKVIQQEVYEWRSRFASAAISAVDDAISEKFGANPRRAEVQAWIRDATSPGGESLWAQPHRNPERAHGSLQSRFVLRSFATHLHATNGSIYLYGPPVGALSLAATAVQHVFPMYKTGRFIPGRAFSSANVGYLTESWYRKSVRRYARREEKFAKLARKASRFATLYYQTKARNGGDTLQAPDVFDRSSPPLEDTDDEADGGGDEYDDDADAYYYGLGK
ncbi:hypothetical protein K466DRAFT_567207 [Polyporus arcularius HHB13444]|uniref:Uncharacterized protein n=1 Tax=Polyporus arcularius HHB13444 TaxID=1314778 RepID=A0A5C3P4T2_9APHY|nr:hypothetical protein K466DRAFT_567207 [Polyporus arcularius HHB13444]